MDEAIAKVTSRKYQFRSGRCSAGGATGHGAGLTKSGSQAKTATAASLARVVGSYKVGLGSN